jgi:5-methylcytosine-specific restriction endonuclease McrA
MTPEELAERHRRDQETRRRKKARMALDPVYREERLAVARRATRKWNAKNRNNPVVVAKRRARDRARWEREGAKQNARSRLAYAGDRAEKIRAANRAWYAANRETVKAQRKAYRQANREALRARERERQRREYARDPKKFNEYMKAWRAANPAKARAYVRVSGNKRRAAAADEHFTFADWLALVAQYAGRCGYCGAATSLEADHRTPLSRGGSNTIDNIIPACPSCNRRKFKKT